MAGRIVEQTRPSASSGSGASFRDVCGVAWLQNQMVKTLLCMVMRPLVTEPCESHGGLHTAKLSNG